MIMTRASSNESSLCPFFEDILKKVVLALAILLFLQITIQFLLHASKIPHGCSSNDEPLNFGSPSWKSTYKEGIKQIANEVKQDTHVSALPLCPAKPYGLQGFLHVSFSYPPYEINQIEENNPLVLRGGYFKPPHCIAISKVAIVIPFRDRNRHLRYFLQYMHPVLQRQFLEYRIYVVNQFGNGKFNRAKLMNIGFSEAVKDFDFACFVFHDVDLILENDHALYNCPELPRHMSSAIDKFNYKILYNTIFGGVTAMTKKQFLKVNGFSNSFWGWGGEDDDLFNRVRLTYKKIIRYPLDTGRYRMISHKRDKGNEDNPERHALLVKQTWFQMKQDGLNSLRYKVISRENHSLYTKITVDIFPPKAQSN